MTLTQGQAIALTNIPPNPDAAEVNVYATNANGDELRHVATIAAGVSSFTIATNDRGDELQTQFMYALPPGQILRQQNGRLLVASGANLYYGEEWRGSLALNGSYVNFGHDITMMEPVGEADAAGVYVAANKRTLYLAGSDPETWRQRIALMESAVPGTGISVPARVFNLEMPGNVACWMSTSGVFCIGLPGGTVRRQAEDRVALASYAQGAMMLREKNGIRQIIAALRGGSTNGFRARDRAVATIRRNGVEV